MNKLLPWIMPMVTALISAAIAHWYFGQSFWLVLLIVFFAVLAVGLINGLIIMLEDGMPGGWDNPNGTEPLLRVRRARKIIWWGLGFLSLIVGMAIWASKNDYW